MTDERFPVLQRTRAEIEHGAPESVPWELIAPHEHQAMRNHSQTLERLAQRGGLGVAELWAVLHDVDWQETRTRSTAALVADIVRIVAEYEEKP